MFLKKLIKSITLISTGALLFTACNKEDTFTPVNMDDLNPDVPYTANTALDQWLKTNFVDDYNSEVTYRYSRFDHEYDRNITPVREEVVQPFMQSVLSGFANPYVSIAGKTFMKINMPKQWNLYGSSNYSASTVYWGQAAGGVRVSIFDLNGYTPANKSLVKDRLGTIHHEFTHILNQRVQMPAQFREISKDKYTGSWETTPDDTARSWGFMRAYSAQSPVEDFADMVKYPVVWGPSWLENLIRTKASAAGAAAIRAKMQSVAEYYNSGLNMDFYALQKQVQLYLKDTLGDPEVTFPYWINQGLYKTLTIDPGDAMYATYGSSAAFNTMLANLRTYLATMSTSRTLNYVQLRFTSPTALVVRVAYTSSAQFFADFNYTFSTNVNAGITRFTKVAQGTGGTYDNAAIIQAGVASTLEPYLTSGTFKADWIPISTPAIMYTKTAGFTKTDDESNYFYGNLGFTL